jgi:hypothetical protein
MISVASAIVIALTGQVSLQTQLLVQASGLPDGTASITQKIAADGTKASQLKLQLGKKGSAFVSVRSESSYNSKGEQTRIFTETISEKPSRRRQVTVTFSGEGAHVVVDESGKREVKAVPLVETAPRANPTEFWFIRDLPKPGTKVQYYHFNANTLTWDLRSSTYVGRKSIRLNGALVNAHRVEMTDGEAYFSSDGHLLQMTNKQMVMTRIKS